MNQMTEQLHSKQEVPYMTSTHMPNIKFGCGDELPCTWRKRQKTKHRVAKEPSKQPLCSQIRQVATRQTVSNRLHVPRHQVRPGTITTAATSAKLQRLPQDVALRHDFKDILPI